MYGSVFSLGNPVLFNCIGTRSLVDYSFFFAELGHGTVNKFPPIVGPKGFNGSMKMCLD